MSEGACSGSCVWSCVASKMMDWIGFTAQGVHLCERNNTVSPVYWQKSRLRIHVGTGRRLGLSSAQKNLAPPRKRAGLLGIDIVIARVTVVGHEERVYRGHTVPKTADSSKVSSQVFTLFFRLKPCKKSPQFCCRSPRLQMRVTTRHLLGCLMIRW